MEGISLTVKNCLKRICLFGFYLFFFLIDRELTVRYSAMFWDMYTFCQDQQCSPGFPTSQILAISLWWGHPKILLSGYPELSHELSVTMTGSDAWGLRNEFFPSACDVDWQWQKWTRDCVVIKINPGTDRQTSHDFCCRAWKSWVHRSSTGCHCEPGKGRDRRHRRDRLVNGWWPHIRWLWPHWLESWHLRTNA